MGSVLLCAVGVATNALAGPTAARPGTPNAFVTRGKLDDELVRRSALAPNDTTKIIVSFKDGRLPADLTRYVTSAHSSLAIIGSHAVEVPNRLLNQLAANPDVVQLRFDRPLAAQNLRTALTTGARALQTGLGLTGAGVGVAIVDSGIASWHDDLTNRSNRAYPYGNQRVSAFVDFVNNRPAPYDDDGHGTHVAGIVAGNGYDSSGQKAGMAPDASLVALKVLDANGQGAISNVIAALDWVLAHHTAYNIRIVNLSVSAQVTESYWTDPLAQAAKRVVDAGIVVVAAAGNHGKLASGQAVYGAIGAPGNAPWVLTVGASSTNGTPARADDTMAAFSSRGPTYLDWAAKPDLVAPGVGTISLAAPGSTLVAAPAFLVSGSVSTSFAPYLTLSGTSMAAPVVSGVVAQMLQANPSLTPNAVKAILEYTAQTYAGYDALTQGAGFLNAVGAVRLAQFFATSKPGSQTPVQAMWSRHIMWGNHMISGGVLTPAANAWTPGTLWGASSVSATNVANIVWGTAAGDDNIVWGTACADNTCDNIVWGTANGDDNIVWGTDCGGADCDDVVWGAASGVDNIVWGTASPTDNIVWGTAAGLDNIVWGTSAGVDNIVWGTASGDDNIVWGTANGDDNVVWGTAVDGAIQWSTGASSGVTPLTPGMLMRLTDEQVFAIISGARPGGF